MLNVECSMEGGEHTIDIHELLMVKILSKIPILPVDRLLQVIGPTYSFLDYFKGFESVEAIKQIFGNRTEEVLQNLKVSFTRLGGYMWVSGSSGRLMVNADYLNNGDKMDIHLDVVHELVHVRQFLEGKELFDSNYSYVERPTEIEAYRYAVEEARRLGLSDERIYRYLKTEWMTEENLRQLAKTLNVNCQAEV